MYFYKCAILIASIEPDVYIDFKEVRHFPVNGQGVVNCTRTLI